MFLLVAATMTGHAQSSSTKAAGTPTLGDTAAATDLLADSSDDDESQQRPPFLASGIAAGALRLDGGRTDQVVSAVLQLQPTSWLTLSAAPGFGRSTVSASAAGSAVPQRSVTSSGLTDIPLSASVWHGFNAMTWSPSVGASLLGTISTGDSSSGLGLGRSAMDADFIVSAQPLDQMNFSLGLLQPLSAASGNGAVSVESAFFLGRSTATISFSNEVGSADSSYALARSVGAGIAYSVAGPLTITLDGSHGLTSGAPGWSVSLGFGTAFAGISPVGATSPFRRLSKVFGKKTTAASGFHHRKSCTRRRC